jgi:hypothetical protein
MLAVHEVNQYSPSSLLQIRHLYLAFQIVIENNNIEWCHDCQFYGNHQTLQMYIKLYKLLKIQLSNIIEFKNI